MPKYTYPGLALAAAGALLALGAASPAQAAAPRVADTLTVGSTTGPNVAAGDKITAALFGSSSLSTSAGNVSCTAGSFAATAATNTAATATLTVTAISFTASSCTSGIPGTTGVTSIGLKAGTTPTATVTASTKTLAVTPVVAVTLSSILGPVNCSYSGAVSGTLSNTAHSLTFSAVTVTRQSGSSALCPSSGKFTATYEPVLDVTQAGGTVYVN